MVIYLIFLDTGQLFTWGRADYGQLGRSHSQSCDHLPKQVDFFSDTKPIAVECGSEHVLVVAG